MTPEEIKAKYARALQGEETFAQAVARAHVGDAAKGKPVSAKPKAAASVPPPPAGWTPTAEQGPPAPRQLPVAPGSGAEPPPWEAVQPNRGLVLPEADATREERFAAMGEPVHDFTDAVRKKLFPPRTQQEQQDLENAYRTIGAR